MSSVVHVAVVHVAVGVIVKDNHILIAKRPDHLHQGGKWEFPGGKVDAGETVSVALVRELQEELNITAQKLESLIQIKHQYTDKTVFLDVYKVTAFSGEPRGNEGQEIRWVKPSELYTYEFPAANQPIVAAVNLPSQFLITGDFSSEEELIARLDKKLAEGFRLIQFRAKSLDQVTYVKLAKQLADRCESAKACLQLNCPVDWFLSSGWADVVGLHLTSVNLMSLHSRPIDSNRWLSASCHTEDEIKKAEAVGLDFIVLSPVNPTSSHPDAIPLGLDAFEQCVKAAKLPVYGLGGLTQSDLPELQQRGAQGVAAISSFWR